MFYKEFTPSASQKNLTCSIIIYSNLPLKGHNMRVTIFTQANGNGNFTDICVGYLNGCEGTLRAIPVTEGETIASVVKQFEMAAQKMSVKKDNTEILIEVDSKDPARFSEGDFINVQSHITHRLNQMVNRR